MCGRTTLSTPVEALEEFLELQSVPAELPPRFNIAPTQPIAVIREPHRLELLRWGLFFGGPEAKGRQGINVRVETVARAPAYRDSFRKRRCVVVVDGFFEWQRREKTKQPFLIRRADGKPFLLAGIWESVTSPDGEIVDACAIITGEARGVVGDVHDRMPLVLPKAECARWLDPKATNLTDLLATSPSELVMHPVSTLVNSPANDDPRCIEPAPETGTLRLF
jgi:putative SOS response-associated peptidase YedK